mmetsp:Transcript_40470/g.84961  ORF Transcript_40470/g.84961 Transcript_40470/m.84961 type:complete len:136 (+) Transcript_40470:643-1050(+)
MQHDIEDQLPREVQKIVDDVDIGVATNTISFSKPEESLGGWVSRGLFHGGFWAIVGTAPLTIGFSLLALPGCAIIAYGHSKAWSRDDVIREVVFGISEQSGKDLCSKITDQVSSRVDEVARKLQECFASMDGREE